MKHKIATAHKPLTRLIPLRGLRHQSFRVRRILGDFLRFLLPQPQAVIGGNKALIKFLPATRRRTFALQQRLIPLLILLIQVEELTHTYRQTSLIFILVSLTLRRRSVRLPQVRTGHNWWTVVSHHQPLLSHLPRQLRSQLSRRNASVQMPINSKSSMRSTHGRRSLRLKNATPWLNSSACRRGVYRYGNHLSYHLKMKSPFSVHS